MKLVFGQSWTSWWGPLGQTRWSSDVLRLLSAHSCWLLSVCATASARPNTYVHRLKFWCVSDGMGSSQCCYQGTELVECNLNLIAVFVLISILILSCHLCQSVAGSNFAEVSWMKFCVSYLSHALFTSCPSYSPWFNEECQALCPPSYIVCASVNTLLLIDVYIF